MATLTDNRDQKMARLECTEGVQLTRRAYNAVIGGVLLFGLLLNVWIVSEFSQMAAMVLNNSPVGFIVAFLVVSFGAIFVVYKSNNPAVSFVGFIVLSTAFGVLVAAVVQSYTSVTVTRAFMLTALVTLTMIAVATVIPSVFAGLGRALFAVLVVTLVAEIAFMLITGTDPVVFDWIFVIVFSLYIGYDWQKAQAYPPTLDNAVDSAADIYVDVVNLFIRILSILGRER